MICAACPCRNRSTIWYSSPGPLRTDTLYFAVAAAKLGVAVSLGVAVGGGMVGVGVFRTRTAAAACGAVVLAAGAGRLVWGGSWAGRGGRRVVGGRGPPPRSSGAGDRHAD